MYKVVVVVRMVSDRVMAIVLALKWMSWHCFVDALCKEEEGGW